MSEPTKSTVNEVKESLPARTPVITNPPVPDRDKSGWLKANTLIVVWVVFLTFGGGLLALYYARIGYLPDIDWSASLIYLAALTIIGVGVSGLFALSLFVPGFIWATFLVFDSDIGEQFCYQSGNGEPCIRAIWRHLGVPFVGGLLISHSSLIVVGIRWTAAGEL